MPDLVCQGSGKKVGATRQIPGTFKALGFFDARCLTCMGVFHVHDGVMMRHYFGADVEGNQASGKWVSKHDVRLSDDDAAGTEPYGGSPPF